MTPVDFLFSLKGHFDSAADEKRRKELKDLGIPFLEPLGILFGSDIIGEMMYQFLKRLTFLHGKFDELGIPQAEGNALLLQYFQYRVLEAPEFSGYALQTLDPEVIGGIKEVGQQALEKLESLTSANHKTATPALAFEQIDLFVKLGFKRLWRNLELKHRNPDQSLLSFENAA